MLNELDVETVAEFEIVTSVNINVPELEIEDPILNVIVPLLGVKVFVTVITPPIVALFEAPVIEPLTFRFP